MAYVDAFVLPLPKRNLPAYKRLARLAARVWKEHGALEYREWLGDDLAQAPVPFTQLVSAKRGETVIVAWIVYKSRAHRDRVNANVMKDPRLVTPAKMPFEVKRLAVGGFSILVDA
jgi:uncharacterized protein YbaA (DUF1428 family)